jgi:hypothetical protein
MTTEEIKRAETPELVRRRMELLRHDCEVCDRGLDRGDCSCGEDLPEIDAIEHEVTSRGESFR